TTVERIVAEGRDLGVFGMVLAGGEPLLREGLVFRLVERHPDTLFLLLTGAGLLDRETARRACAPNLLVLVGADAERGDRGAARGALAAARASFGFTAVVDRENASRYASQAFLARMRDDGCRVGMFFERMPVGRAAGSDYGFDGVSRRGFRRAIRIWQRRIGIPLRFYPDGEGEFGGCAAAGKAALHINARGDVEPCPFIRVPLGSVEERSLADVLLDPGLAAVRAVAARSAHREPCALLGHPALTDAGLGAGGRAGASPC
ncbi:MAG: SPASM domain-containing protein, partial [Planctomycetota bacterium]